MLEKKSSCQDNSNDEKKSVVIVLIAIPEKLLASPLVSSLSGSYDGNPQLLLYVHTYLLADLPVCLSVCPSLSVI